MKDQSWWVFSLRGLFEDSYAEGGAKAHSQFINTQTLRVQRRFLHALRLVEMTGGGLFGYGCVGVRWVLWGQWTRSSRRFAPQDDDMGGGSGLFRMTDII